MKALVIIDMQTWMFRTPDRMAQVPGLLLQLGKLVDAFKASQLPIFDVRTVHQSDRSTWSRLMLKYDYPCLLEETADVLPVEGYQAPLGAVPIRKTANSVFLGTDFDARLRQIDVNHLVLAGVFIDGCVGLTAADAAQRRYEVTFVEDAIGHTELHLRAPLFEWLVNDYELESRKASELLGLI